MQRQTNGHICVRIVGHTIVILIRSHDTSDVVESGALVKAHAIHPELGYRRDQRTAATAQPAPVAGGRKVLAHCERYVSADVQLVGAHLWTAGLRDIATGVCTFPGKSVRAFDAI